MRRYRGEPLPPSARIAIVANDALGNYVASTPLIQVLRNACPDCLIHYYGGHRTEELWSRESMIDGGFALYGSRPSQLVAQMQRTVGEYDLVVNFEASDWARCFTAIAAGEHGAVVGPCLGTDGRGELSSVDDAQGALAEDPAWTSADLVARHPILNTGFMGEIFCRLTYFQGPIPSYRVARDEPPMAIPDVLISTSASLPDKLWPFEKWEAILRRLREEGCSIGLLGAKPSPGQRFWLGPDTENRIVAEGLAEDLRGRLTLPQVVGALGHARLAFTLDNGILHLAAAAGVPIVGLFRHGIHRLWAPPVENLAVLTPGEGRIVAEIPVETVWEAIRRAG